MKICLIVQKPEARVKSILVRENCKYLRKHPRGQKCITFKSGKEASLSEARREQSWAEIGEGGTVQLYRSRQKIWNLLLVVEWEVLMKRWDDWIDLFKRLLPGLCNYNDRGGLAAGAGVCVGRGVAAREDEGDQLGCYSICYSKKEMMVVHRSVEAVQDHTNL